MHATRLIGRQGTDRDRKRRKTQILLLQLTTRYVNSKGEDSSSFFFLPSEYEQFSAWMIRCLLTYFVIITLDIEDDN